MFSSSTNGDVWTATSHAASSSSSNTSQLLPAHANSVLGAASSALLLDESPADAFTQAMLGSNTGAPPAAQQPPPLPVLATAPMLLSSASSASTGGAARPAGSSAVYFHGAVAGEQYSFGDALRHSSGSPTRSPFLSSGVDEVSETARLLQQVNDRHHERKAQLEKVRPVQRQLMLSPTAQAYEQLSGELAQLLNLVTSEQAALSLLEHQHLLTPLELAQLDYLGSELNVQAEQVLLFQQELQQLGGMLSGGAAPTGFIATMVVHEQPFPCVLTKGKCLARDTPVLMHDGSVKAVQDVCAGDLVMGDDSTPRRVTAVTSGRQPMVRVESKLGASFVCNASHVLSLKLADLPARVGARSVRFVVATRHRDGTVAQLREHTHTCADASVANALLAVADKRLLAAALRLQKNEEAVVRDETLDVAVCDLLNRACVPAGVYSQLQTYSAGVVRFPPLRACGDAYVCGAELARGGVPALDAAVKLGDEPTRRRALAGFLETCARVRGSSMLDVSALPDTAVRDVLFVARSLGRRAHVAGGGARLCVGGDGGDAAAAAAREALRLTALPVGDFYGFSLDGNRRFLLGAFQVTHNSLEDDEVVVVQLLSGASTQFTSFSMVNANVIWDAPQVKGAGKVFLKDSEVLDPTTRTATFRFKVNGGTRKVPVSLKFSLQAQINNHAVTIESTPSQPFVVITNECQYEESVLLLLKRQLFASDSVDTVCAWPSLANKLQRQFLLGTRQDLVKPQRALSSRETAFIHAKFFNNTPQITLKQLEQFWTWFGPTLQKVRYQRHVASMWTAGLIYGLIERQNVHRILLHQEVGACLIRFSENHPGFFAISYKIFDDDLEKSVRHYLVTADDVGTKKTLPDFLGESAQFKFIAQVSDQVDANGEPRLKFVPKDIVLDAWYAKKTAAGTLSINGYDTQLTGGEVAPEFKRRPGDQTNKRTR
jgi:hypothetical protein